MFVIYMVVYLKEGIQKHYSNSYDDHTGAGGANFFHTEKQFVWLWEAKKTNFLFLLNSISNQNYNYNLFDHEYFNSNFSFFLIYPFDKLRKSKSKPINPIQSNLSFRKQLIKNPKAITVLHKDRFPKVDSFYKTGIGVHIL